MKFGFTIANMDCRAGDAAGTGTVGDSIPHWWPLLLLRMAGASPPGCPGHRWPPGLRIQSRRARAEAAADRMRHPNWEPHQSRYLDDHGNGQQDSHMDFHSTA